MAGVTSVRDHQGADQDEHATEYQSEGYPSPRGYAGEESGDKEQQANHHEDMAERKLSGLCSALRIPEVSASVAPIWNWSAAPIGTVGKLLIDCEEDRVLRAVLVDAVKP
jgi:hypothetical protein